MMITLVCKEEKLTVPIQQAERIFKLQKEIRLTNWQLSEDSPYHLVDGKLIKHGNTKAVPGKAKKKGD